MTQFYIYSCSPHASNSDKERALEAFEKSFEGVDAAVAFEDFKNGKETALSEKWLEADLTANLALTEGWHDPNSGYIEIAVY